MAVAKILRPNRDWLEIITHVLDGEGKQREEARATMWGNVKHFVEHVDRGKLPIGPLADDDDALRDIAVRVLEKLERHDFAHLREWRRRQLSGRDAAQWWTFIRLVVRSKATDYARGSPLNIARRGSRKDAPSGKAAFEWVRVEPTEASVLSEQSTARFLARCTWPQLFDFLDKLNGVRAPASELPLQPRPALASPQRRAPATERLREPAGRSTQAACHDTCGQARQRRRGDNAT